MSSSRIRYPLVCSSRFHEAAYMSHCQWFYVFFCPLLVLHLFLFSRPGPSVPTAIDINKIIASNFTNSFHSSRIRRVKCDEEKPACLRCTSTGRKCDGYVNSEDPPVDMQNERQLTPIQPSLSTCHINSAFVDSDQEYRAFDFFKSRTGPELSSAMKSTFWQSIILQISHHDIAIRHAVVACGSISETLHINGVLTLDNKEANQRHTFACFQYDKALKELRKQLSSRNRKSVEFTLISCFLFICIEFLQGNDAGLLAHLRSGLKIFQSVQNEMNTETIGQVSLSSDAGDFKTHTRRLYHLLDWLAALWLGNRVFLQPIEHENHEPYVSMPKHFSCISDTNEHLYRWMDQVYLLNHLSTFLDRSEKGATAFQTIRARQDYLVGEGNRWLLNVESLLIRLGDGFGPEDVHQITVMTINHRVISMILGSVVEADEAKYYRAMDSSFEQIISLSSTVLFPVNVMTNCRVFPTSKNMFSFIEGVIRPLHFTAIKCNNLKICRKAISLLKTSPWREGAWESASMAKIAERKITQLKNEGFYKTPTGF